MKFLSSLKKPVVIKRKTRAATEISQSEVSLPTNSIVSPRIPSTPSSLGQSFNSTSTSHSIFQDIPQEVIMSAIPMIKIINSQTQKAYFDWNNENNDSTWICTINDQEDRTIEKLVLIGTTVYLDLNDQTKTSIPIINRYSADSNIILHEKSIDFISPSVTVSCNDLILMTSFQKLVAVSLFEHFSVFKSLTGSIISSMGLKMPDINMILNSQFNFKDWCEIYIKGDGWVKAWCHINKMSNKSDKYEPKGKYQIKFYRDNKSLSPNSNLNLICYIPDSNYVQDMFFYNFENVEQPNDAKSTDFLNNIKTIKLIGDILYPEDRFTLRTPSTNSSFAKQLISPKRGISTSPIKPSKSGSFRRSNKGLLIRPLPHRGLSHLDAMIKFIIPMMDVTRKYGRPTQFIATTKNINSLMFGLPKLPNTNYFDETEIQSLINEKVMDYSSTNETLAYSMNWISKILNEYIEIKPDIC